MVFPTPVGVFPYDLLTLVTQASLPHARGGVSEALATACTLDASSPRPWGCFRVEPELEFVQPVFPTPVGVFLRRRRHPGGA